MGMTKQEYAYIGIDLGTSGCRAIAIDDDKQIIASSHKSLKQAQAPSSKSEQDPNEHWQIVLDVLSEVIHKCQKLTIKAIAVDATSGSILFVDKHGAPLTSIIMYNDARAAKQSDVIADIAPKESAAHGVSSGLSKALYQLEHADIPPTSKLLHQADWINFKLGAPLAITDENNALKTGYDPIKRYWPDWIDTLIDSSLLPDVVPVATTIGQLSNHLCQQFNLDYRPELIAGTTDSIAAFIATGANQLGDAVTSLGSSLVVKLITKTPLFVPELGIYSHRLADYWLVGGASNTGGAVLKHYFDASQLQQLSEKIDLNTKPLDYYPLLSKGERFPVNDPHLEPQLTPKTDDVTFLYGMLNGIANIEKQAYHCLQHAGSDTLTSIRTVGGGAINPVRQQIRQSKFTIDFITPNQTEAAYGAALVAMKTMR